VQIRPSGCLLGIENVMAEARTSDRLSPIVGLIALIEAARAWRLVAMEARRDEHVPHPEAGAISAFDVVQRNARELCHHLLDIQRAPLGNKTKK
jgi:hypothetical protein